MKIVIFFINEKIASAIIKERRRNLNEICKPNTRKTGGSKMATTEQLDQQAKNICKLVDEGKGLLEIAEDLALTPSQVKYRLKTKCSKQEYEQLLNKLKQNSKKEKPEPRNKRKPSIVMDTCVLKHETVWEVIKKYPKVILITDVIRELDKLKNSTDPILNKNVKRILKECAEDEAEEQYKVVLNERVSTYTDENLIHYCKGKNVILFTSDNTLACLARAYGIRYVLGEKMEREILQAKTKLEETRVRNIDTQKLSEKIRQNGIVIESKRIHEIDNVEYREDGLFLTIPDTNKIGYIVLSNNEIAQTNNNRQIRLEIENLLFILTYKAKHNGLCVSIYRIIDIAKENYAVFIKAYKPNTIQEIQQIEIPEVVQNKIIEYFEEVSQM